MRELIGREGNDKYVIFSFYRSFFGNPILAMVNGVLLLLSWSMANLSRAVEREGGRKETRNCGGEKRRGREKENGREAESLRTTVCFTVWQIHIDHNGSAANGGVCSVTRDLH